MLREDLLTKYEIEECFSNMEVYKTIIMDPTIVMRF